MVEVIIENNSAPRSYKVIVHLLSILGPALLWVLFIGNGVAQALATDPRSTTATIMLAVSIVGCIHFVLVAFIFALAYALAGGLEWKAQRLHIARVGIYIAITGVIPGLLLVSVWLFIRSALGSMFKLNGLAAVGRLFRVNEII